MASRLADLGWDAAREDELAALGDGLMPARVTCRHHGRCELLAERGPLGGLPATRLEGAGLPVVGDWVAIRPVGKERKAIIEHVLTRRGTLSRKEAWRRTREQVIAANVDTVLVVTDAIHDLNPRRLERYLVAIAASGAAAAVVVNKADAAEPRALEAALRAAGDMPAYAVSAATGVGLPALRAHLRPGRTAALVGSSGVGKSTLVNRLAGRPLARRAPSRPAAAGATRRPTATSIHCAGTAS